ncbi:MAG: FIST N-terminal domain-containing protein [Kineosporiaceae bacterium]
MTTTTGSPAQARTETAPRWFGVGSSADADPVRAARQATSEALQGAAPALMLVLTSHEGDLAGLVAAIRAQAGPDVAIVGTTTCGEITRPGPGERTVVVTALGGPGFTARTAIGLQGEDGQRAAGQDVALGLTGTGREHEVLLVLGDGLTQRQHDLVRGIYSVVGAGVPLAGACGGNLTYTDAQQFRCAPGEVVPEVVRHGVVAAAVGSDAPIGVGVAHGWRPSGEPMNITASSDTLVYEIDHRPALDVYLERLGVDDGVTADPGAFFEFTHRHPLGVARRGGEDIRVIQSADLEQRTITCFADAQQGTVAWIMETDPQALVDGGAQSCRQALDALAGAPPLGVLAFDCAVRKLQLGADGVAQEIAGMRGVIGEVPLAGFYSMGEICRTKGARGMHHMTSVSVAFA